MKNSLLIFVILIPITIFRLQAFNGNESESQLNLDSLELVNDENELLETYGYAPKIKNITTGFNETFLNNVKFTNKFKTTTSILQEDLFYSSEKLNIKKVYPNPADEVAYLDYSMMEQLKAKIIVRNLLGKVMKEYDLNKGEGQIKIPTYKFETGYYFYTLSINGKSIKAKKLVIEHR